MEEKQYKLIPMTFFWMFLGLLGTALIAIYSYNTDLVMNLVFDGYFSIVLIVELVVVILFSFLFMKLPSIVVTILYFVYAMINGLTLSTIFYQFELESIITIFGSTAVLFALLAILGYKTNTDVSRWQPILMWTLIVGLIASIINLFLGYSLLDTIIDWVVLVSISGITIYDMNRLKMIANESEVDQNKVHIYCAMQLYLDFINIFIRFLSLFGKRRD